jgi:hypothetical protein
MKPMLRALLVLLNVHVIGSTLKEGYRGPLPGFILRFEGFGFERGCDSRLDHAVPDAKPLRCHFGLRLGTNHMNYTPTKAPSGRLVNDPLTGRGIGLV